MIDEKRIPQRIYIKDSQLVECEIEGIADARINAVPYKCRSGKICEYINVDNLWHDASEKPEFDKRLLTQHITLMGELGYDLTTNILAYPWELYVKGAYITKWCYIEDILPSPNSSTRLNET